MTQTKTDQPRRIHRSRLKGWRTPPNTKYVGRTGRADTPHGLWGNPYTGPSAAIQFRALFTIIQKLINLNDWEGLELTRKKVGHEIYHHMFTIVSDVKQLKGLNLSCSCGLTESCHADTLLAEANK